MTPLPGDRRGPRARAQGQGDAAPDGHVRRGNRGVWAGRASLGRTNPAAAGVVLLLSNASMCVIPTPGFGVFGEAEYMTSCSLKNPFPLLDGVLCASLKNWKGLIWVRGSAVFSCGGFVERTREL